MHLPFVMPYMIQLLVVRNLTARVYYGGEERTPGYNIFVEPVLKRRT